MFSNDTTIVDLLMETFIRMFPVRCASDIMYMELFLGEFATQHVFQTYRHR